MRILTVVLTWALLAWCAAGEVTIRFVDSRPGEVRQSLPAFITFGGAGPLVARNVKTNGAITKGVSYPLAELSEGVLMSRHDSGRIFVSFGLPLASPNAANGFSPNFANPTLPDFSTRWDKIELTFDGANGGANITAQDFFGISLELRTTNPTTVLTSRATAEMMMRRLAQLANLKASSATDPTGALVLGRGGVRIPGVNGEVVRVISPASVPPKMPSGGTVYSSFADYLSSLKSGKTIIAGNNGQARAGGPIATYNFTVTIEKAAGTVGGVSVKAGDLVFNGTVNEAGTDQPTVIVVAAASLTDTVIYGANPPYNVARGVKAPIIDRAIADYFAGLNFGLVGSPVDNPKMPGTRIGDSPSWTWYGNRPNGENQSPLSQAMAYAKAQPTATGNYNQYAAYLARVSDTYGFAYNDRLASPLAAFHDGSTMTITILPDHQLPVPGKGR